MMTGNGICGKCGAKIAGNTRQEVCPACLLENGLGPLDHESVAAVVDSRPDEGLRDPKKKASRSEKVLGDFGDYELLEEIGRGGQGVVYSAHQKSLNRTVALKVIGLGPWTTETHLKRFRREVEAAACLEHPCIVPIYEVGERDSQCYFSMKFIEGGQLDEVVRRTPRSIRQAAELVAKVARTVHYAHEHGILHRDIKPGNILLDVQGEPHLTDFGLARLGEAESSVTGTLEVMGTPSYMAPEQAAGETGTVGKATDVYGLGAVLYQLLTAHPPFAAGTTYETIKLLLDTEPKQPRLLNPKIDRDLSTICLKCLEKDPKLRYSSALALAEDLEHWLKHEPICAKPSGFFARGRKWARRKPAIAALLAALVALAATMAWNLWKSELFRAAPEKSIALLPFENLSRDPDNAYFAEGMQDEIRTDLIRMPDLKVISRTSTMQYKSEVARDIRKIGYQLGVANILEGSVRRAGNRIRVNAQLVDARTYRELWGQTYDRDLTDVFAIQSDIAKTIAVQLQAKLTGREEQALAVKPTNNPEAYDAYLRGVASEARSSSSSVPSASSEAAGFYERAVQLDPKFAVAWARLSRADANLYFGGLETTPGARRAGAKRALESAQRLAPDSTETLLALGYYQYWVLRDYGSAKTTFERLRISLPGASEIPRALAYVTRRQGHWDESIAYFEQALVLDPRNVELLMDVAWTYTMLRQFPSAVKLYDRALDITPKDPDVMAAKASIYQAQGNLEEAAKLLSGVMAKTSSGDTVSIKFDQLRLERNYSEAVRLLQTRLAQFHYDSEPDKASDQLALALAQRLAGDTTEAKVTAQAARNTLEQLYRDLPDSVSRAGGTARLSLAYAAMGQKDSAFEAAQRAIMFLPRSKDPVAGPHFEENLALIQTTFGENSRAISTLTQLLQTPYKTFVYGLTPITPALLRLDPIWDPLRSDPAFQKLCEEKQLH